MTKNIKAILSTIIVSFLVVLVVLPCTMKVAAETTDGSSGSTSKVYTHNFTEDGLTSDFFTIDGNTTDSKGAVVYNGMDLSICLKMQSSPKTSIKFTTKTDGATLTVVTKTTESSATLKLDGGKWGNTITGDLTVITKKLGNASTYELTKGSGESLIYFIMVEEAGETTTTSQAPTTEAPTTEAPTTEAPTTEAPTTEAPTTEAPTTEAPTTEAPTTEAPTTEAPTTEAPTTEAPTTEAPTTEAPTTTAPTEHPTTSESTKNETIGTSPDKGDGNSDDNEYGGASPNKMENNEKGTGIGDIFTAIIVLLVIIAIIALIVFDSPLKKFLGGIINGKSNSNY